MDWKQLEKDRENGTPGPWRSGVSDFYPGLDGPLSVRVYTTEAVEEAIVSGDVCRANADRIARVPDLEALALAGRELAAQLGAAKKGFDALLDLNLLPERYRDAAQQQRDEARAALARWKEAGGEDE